MYIDTHAHLTDSRYNNEGANIIKNLSNESIKYIINIGYDRQSSDGSVEFAKAFDNVYAAVAIHPHDCLKAQEADFAAFAEYAKHSKVVAIGETGLDYHYENCPSPSEQKKVFIRHLQLAYSVNLPVIIHLRDAYADMYEILSANKHLLRFGGVLHCYSGSAEMAKKYLDLGLYISFAGAVTFKNARGLIDSVRAVPADKMLTETDCPYLTPEPHRGELNYPAYVKYVAKKLAQIKELSESDFCEKISQNARALFKRITHL